MRGLVVSALALALAGTGQSAPAQDPGTDDLARALTEKFLGIGAESRSEPTAPTPAPPVATPAPAPPATLFGLPLMSSPPAPASPAGPGRGAASQQFLLAGVVIAGEQGMAFLREPGQPGPRFVRVGESVGGYRLTAVGTDRATLSGPGGDLVVLLGGASFARPPSSEPAVAGEPAAHEGPRLTRPGETQPGSRKQAREERKRARQEQRSSPGAIEPERTQ